MKTVLWTAIVLLMSISAVAQEMEVSPVMPETEPNNMDAGIDNDLIPQMKSCPFCLMGAQRMFGTQLVPLEDGGVLLMTAGKLYKYDQNLNLVAETEVVIDYEQIQTHMREMMNHCPMCRQKMQMIRGFGAPPMEPMNGRNNETNGENGTDGNNEGNQTNSRPGATGQPARPTNTAGTTGAAQAKPAKP